MKLQTASEVSKAFGISTRMLRYYEQAGLIKGLRKDDYAYRLYDTENLARLQQIVILRKLQIPVKQIAVILNNPDAATAILIFNENIIAIQNEVTALDTIKAALQIFINKIEELAVVHLDLNLLTDKTVIELAKSLSLTQKNVKEYQTMENVKQASDYLTEKSEKHVTVIRLPKCKIITSGWQWEDDMFHVKGGFNDWVWENRHLHKEVFYGTPAFWMNIKPDYHGELSCYNITVQDNIKSADAAPYKLIDFEGGLYAALQSANNVGDNLYMPILKWLESSSYEPDTERFCLAQEIYHNQNTFHPSEITKGLGYNQFQWYIPIKLRTQNMATVETTLEAGRAEIVKKFFTAFHERFGVGLERHFTAHDFDRSEGASAYVAYSVLLDAKDGVSITFEINADDYDPCVLAGFSMVKSGKQENFGDKETADELRKHIDVGNAKTSDWYLCYEHLMYDGETINLVKPHWGNDNYAKLFDTESFNKIVDSSVDQARLILAKLKQS